MEKLGTLKSKMTTRTTQLVGLTLMVGPKTSKLTSPPLMEVWSFTVLVASTVVSPVSTVLTWKTVLEVSIGMQESSSEV